MQNTATLMNRLREETRAQHEALHVHPLLAPLTSSGITREDYYWVVRAFYGAYAVSEAAREIASADIADAPVLSWLQADMKLHGLEPLALDAAYPAIDTESKMMGYLYVKQGSTLGGNVISKHLAKTLGLKPGETNHFFAGYGEKNGECWKAFVTRLNSAALKAPEVLVQATATFEHIKHCCDRALGYKQGTQA